MQYNEDKSRIFLSDLNEHITCRLCKGYLIDAVTITECLHSYCKSCIIIHLENNFDCPACGNIIHQSHPLNYISFDRTLQDIVYKLVPKLRENEQSRRDVYYRSIGKAQPPSEDLINHVPRVGTKNTNNHITTHGQCPSRTSMADPTSSSDPQNDNFHRNEEHVLVKLEPGSSLAPLRLKYLCLSSRATVTHLRKYVAQQVLHDISRFNDIDIFILNNEDGTFLGRDHVLKFVRVVYWNDDRPMPLQYRFSRTLY